MSLQLIIDALNSRVGDPGAKLVLITLCDYAGTDDLGWPSLATLTRRTELSESSVRRKLQYLVELGLVEPAGLHRSGVQIYRVKPNPLTAMGGVSLTPPYPDGGVTVTEGGVTLTERGVTLTPEPVRTSTEPRRAHARGQNRGHLRLAGPTSGSKGGGQRPSAALAEYDRAAAAALPLDENRQRAAAIAEQLAGKLGGRP